MKFFSKTHQKMSNFFKMAEKSFYGGKSSFKGKKSSFKLFGKIEFPSKRTKKACHQSLSKSVLCTFICINNFVIYNFLNKIELKLGAEKNLQK